MTSKTLKAGLSAPGIDSIIDAVQAYRDGLAGKAGELVEQLAESGALTARAALVMPEGELAPTISIETVAHMGSGSSVAVVSSGEHAAFVEFGVGVVGAGTYPATLPVSWPYDTRRTPAAHDKDDPTLWHYHDDYGTERSTRGVTANAYMLAAAESMRQKAVSTAKGVFA